MTPCAVAIRLLHVRMFLAQLQLVFDKWTFSFRCNELKMRLQRGAASRRFDGRSLYTNLMQRNLQRRESIGSDVGLRVNMKKEDRGRSGGREGR